jgi:dTDP-4-amino-4,6-dideoxygalactose transaminase
MEVPLVKPDLPRLSDIAEPLAEVLTNGKVSNFGKYMNKLEVEIGAFLDVPAVAVSSGTTALILALRALGLQPGHRVVVPSLTFLATAQAVLLAGGIPVFAEVGEDLTMSPDDLRYLLQKHSDIDVVLPVHIYGQPCQVDVIADIVRQAGTGRARRISVLYDAAHAFGAKHNETRLGHFGDAEVFSLSFSKVLNSVEGGLVSSSNPDLLARIEKLRNYGIERNYEAHEIGLNGKLSEFHAIVGLHNLRQFSRKQTIRLRRADWYLEKIASLKDFSIPSMRPNSKHAYKDMVVLVRGNLADKRDTVMDYLKSRGIETRAYFFPPLHEQVAFQRYADRALPYTSEIARRVICLPFYTSITRKEINYVVGGLIEAEERFA